MSVPLSWSTQATTNASGAFTLTLPNMLSAGQVAIIDSLTIAASVALTGAVAELRQSGTPIGWISGRGQYGPFRTYAGEIIEVLMTGGPATTRVSVTVRGQRFLPHEACPEPGQSESEFDRAAAGMGPGIGISEPDPVVSAAAPSIRATIAGDYYYILTGSNITAGTIPSDWRTLTPLYLDERTTFDRISARVNSSAAATLIRLGVYENDNGYPGALIVDAGTVDKNTIGLRTLTIALTLDPGIYWLCAHNQTNDSTMAKIVTDNASNPIPYTGEDTPGGINRIPFGGLFENITFATLPAPYPAGAARSNGNAVLTTLTWVGLRKA